MKTFNRLFWVSEDGQGFYDMSHADSLEQAVCDLVANASSDDDQRRAICDGIFVVDGRRIPVAQVGGV